MFLLKKIVAPLFYPVSFGLGILVLGLVFLWFTRKERTGRVLVTLGTILLITLSYSAGSNYLLGPLEYKYPPLMEIGEDLQDVKWVVVLGGGHISDPRVPVTSQLSDSATVRVVEGVRLHRMIPGSKLLLGGGAIFDPVPNARVMANVALAIGVNEENIVLQLRSKDTKDEARIIKEMVGDDRFILVTSAFHMPRSMALFKKQGMDPIPAPTGHWVMERQGASPGMFFPGAGELLKAEMAVHEYLGLVWAKLRGQI